MLIELHCRICGRAYIPTREDLARGPECRLESQSESHQGESQSAAAAALRGTLMVTSNPHGNGGTPEVAD
jgi:hypothetical protein